ncbi:Fibronectin type III domain protein [compost metagenome]
MRKILLKHLAALKKVSMLFIVCTLGANMNAQIIIAESFEGPQFPPPGWKIDNSYSSPFKQYSGNASHGVMSARMGTIEARGNHNNRLWLPTLALTAGQTVQISFDYTVLNLGEDGGGLRFGVEHIGENHYAEEILWEIDFTTLVPYTTKIVTFTAEGSENYSFFFHTTAPLDNLAMALDKIIIENAPACTAPADIIVTETTSNVFNLDWNAAGTETAWEVQVTNGDLPVAANWIEVNTSEKAINVIPGRTYSAYVRSKCPGGGYSSFYGPKIFTVPCQEIITAPYNIPFAANNLPACWQQSGDTAWKFDLVPDYAASKAGDHSVFEGYTKYAWVDGSTNTAGKRATLLSPKIDVSGLDNPAVEFYVYSGNDNNNVFNKLLAEVFDGTTWQTAATLTTASNGWKFYSIDLTALNITTITQLRITITGNTQSDATHFNDILIDDISFKEKTTCLPLSNFTTGLITDISADISWDSDNNASTWEVAYRRYYDNFDGIANSTGLSNTYTLNGLEANTQYDIYIRANCGNGVVGEWTGPYYLQTDCPVYTPYFHESFDANYSFPYNTQNPGIPNCWTKASGGDITNGPSEYSTGDWVVNLDAFQGGYTNSFINSPTVSLSFHGSTNKSWFISPLFNLSEGPYEAKMKIGLDPGNASFMSMGSDDKVQMVYSENGTDWQVVKTWSAEDNLTTGYNTSIVSLEGITGENIRFAFLADEGVVADNIAYKFHLDDLIIREKSICVEPINLSADGITNVSAKIGWENQGTATSWKVAVVAPGVVPTNEWQTALSNPYNVQSLTANTLYDVYVKSVCGGVESEVTTGPLKFKTRCAPIVAPYTETFVEYYEVPECWLIKPLPYNPQGFLVDYWQFTTEAKFDASTAGDHTDGVESQYAWLNTAAFNNKERGVLTTALVDVSSLQHPALQFYMFSKNTIDNALNHLIVEVYNGTQWVEATRVENYTNNWAPYTIDLTPLGVTGITEARFTVIINANGGNIGYNNILIDDVAFIEMPQCVAPINLVVTEITDTTAEVVWENTGTSTSWEIEYGPKGFTPGEGTVVTVNTTPEVTLTELDDNQEYDVYIKSLCDSELVGPQTFITDTTSGIEDFDIAKIILYPNPVTDVLNIESTTTIDTIEVYTIVGQLVKKQSVNSGSATILVSELSEGIYMVKAFSGKNVGTYKVIKK